MQLFNIVISAVMIGCALALSIPQAENKLVLTDIDGIKGVKAIDLQKNAEFIGDVKSKADVVGMVNEGGSNMHEWKVGASDDGAHAGDNQVSSSGSGGSSNFAANNDNKLVISQFGNVQNFVGSDANGGKVNGIATGSNGNGRVNGRVDSVKPWEADWTDDMGIAKAGGNSATAERKDNETIAVKGAQGSGTAKHNQTGVAYEGSRFFDGKYSATATEDGAGNSDIRVNQKLFGVVDKTISGKTDNESNAVSISENNKEYAKVSMIRSSEGPCDEEKYHNKFSKSDDGFKIDEDSVKIEMQPTTNSNGELTYEWPSCFDISMVMTLPVGVDVRNLAAQLEVSLPMRQKFTCQQAYNCGSYNCFYKDLCNPQANQGLEKTIAVNDVLSNSETNACSAQSRRQLPFKATVCPDESTVANAERKAINTNYNVLDQVFEDVETTMKLYEVNNGFSCNVFSQFFNKPTQVGCRKASASYAVRYNGNFQFSARELEENFWNKPKTAATARPAPKVCNKPKYCSYFPHFDGCKC